MDTADVGMVVRRPHSTAYRAFLCRSPATSNSDRRQQYQNIFLQKCLIDIFLSLESREQEDRSITVA